MMAVVDDTYLWVTSGEQKFEWELFRNVLIKNSNVLRRGKICKKIAH